MTHAYDESCLARASDSLGRMLDYAFYSLHYDIASMMSLFIASGDAAAFERGDIRTIAGMSGIELAFDVLERSGLAFERTNPRYTKSLSAEYWCGYTLAQIQWETSASFASIIQLFSVQDFVSSYSQSRTAFLDSLPLSISESERKEEILSFGLRSAADAVSAFTASPETVENGAAAPVCALRKLRASRGLSQSGLAKASGIPVRTIQQYEQGRKDLSKARAEYLIALARALHCDPAKLISRY